MSTRLLPAETVAVLRHYVDVALDAVGMDCTLYIPTNTSYEVAQRKDIYAVPGDYEYLSYSAKVFVNWNPSTYKLKQLGLFVEDSLPILCWFGNKATALSGSEAGSEVSIDVCKKGYFELEPEFIPGNYKDIVQFEIVNVALKGFQDAVIRKIYSAVPRRVKI